MKVDGYALREAIKQWELRKGAAEQAFKGSLNRFPGEEAKEAPQQVVASFSQAEEAIATLQVAQMRYNLAVTVSVSGETMPLAKAIKMIGGEGRVEKMWKTAAAPQERISCFDDRLTRDPTQERAVPTMTQKDLVRHAASASKRCGSFRAAIATANATSIDITDLNPRLFE